jgi:rhodanese-related sulfurtransferase
MFLLTIVLLSLLLATSVAVVGCGDDTETTSDDTTTTATDSSTVIADRAIEVLAVPFEEGLPGNSIAAEDLSAMMADPAMMETMQLVDIRKKEDYDAGHIEGAIQIDFLDWANPENIAQLDPDKKVVVICYTGNTAAQAAMGMRIIGIDAVTLKAGMTGWVAGTGAGTIADLQAASNAVVNDPPMMESATAPEATFTQPTGEEYDILADKMNEVFSAMPEGAANVIKAEDLKTKIDAGDMADTMVLDVRSAEDFATVGHIDGAMNIPFNSLAVPDNLSMLSMDQQIVVACYTGNTAAQAVTVLKMLGYDAVALKYGMMGWTQTPNTAGYIEYLNAANYPVVQPALS